MNRSYRMPIIWVLIHIISSSTALPTDATSNAQFFETSQETTTAPSAKAVQPEWLFIVYMAADNDLKPFAGKNLAQLTEIGSNNNITVVVHLDTRAAGNKKITKRYYVAHKQLILISQQMGTQAMDSGDPETLIDCCRWAISSYPAKHVALILWNHGTGPIDIGNPRAINASHLFHFNPHTNLIELDRSVPFLEFMSMQKQEDKGICFDDGTGRYLSNQKLAQALETICKQSLQNKKFSLIGCDACLMSMIEIADIAQPFADYLVGSQEVELGSGWNYNLVLAPFMQRALSPAEFSKHIVHAYEQNYKPITQDYTQSALFLNTTEMLQPAINKVASLLLEALHNQRDKTVSNALKLARNRMLLTHFNEPTYVDLHHLCMNLLTNAERFQLHDRYRTETLKQELFTALRLTTDLITKSVAANVTGANLSKAHGISIYFPDRFVHPSYRKTSFVQKNPAWLAFIDAYLQLCG